MRRILLNFFALFVMITANGQAYLDDIMFQSFGWDEYMQPRVVNEGGLYEFYNARAGNLKANGFDMVWLPPPSVSTGGVGYFPTELFNFSQTSWGSEAQLRKMLTNMNARGIYPIADVVANHRSGTTGWTDFTNPAWGCDAIVSDDEAATDPGNTGCKPTGNPDTGEGFHGSRDMDHTNLTVRNGYKEFLTRLKGLGFKGWRWDVAKGFSPQYFGEYIGASQPYYSVGEYWDGNVAALKNWINGTYTGGVNISGTFDFAAYYTLSKIIQENPTNNYSTLNVNGHMAGLAGEYGFAEKAVTFVDNHDTFVHNSAFQGNNIMVAYAYILTHPGIPSVFAPHYYGGTYSKDGTTRNYGTGYADKINQLTAIRKATGLNAFSSITIDKAEAGLYAAYIKKADTDAEPSVAMKIGPYTWTPTGTGWTLATSGTNYSVWTKTAVNTPPSISMSPSTTTYVKGATVNVTLEATDTSGTPTIRYTTDGSEPTASSPVYSGPIALTSTTTIKAAAFDDKGLSSGTLERTFTFNTPKTIIVRFNPAGSGWTTPYIHYWGAQPAGVLADAVWGTPVAMTADPNNAGWFMYTFNNVTSVNLLFRNGDASGVPGTTQTGDFNNVTQDTWYKWITTSPYAEAVPCPVPASALTAPTVVQPTCAVPTGTITFAPITGYSYSINDGATWSTNNKFTGVAPGTYTLVQKNINGCWSDKTTVTLNAVSETVQLTTKEAVLDLAGKSSVALNADQVVSTATASCGGTLSYTLSPNSFSAVGVYTVTVTAKTAGGATATGTAKVTVKDSYASMPQLFKITAQHETCDTKNNGAIIIESTQNLAYSYSLNGGAWTNFTSPHTIPNLNAGAYNLCIKLPSGTEYCYVINIGKPANLTGKISVSGKTATVEITSGTAPFVIQYGDQIISKEEMGTYEIPLAANTDKITVTSSKLCEGTITEFVIPDGEVKLYPNPVKDILYINGFANDEMKVSVYSVSGQLVTEKNFSAFDRKMIDMKSFSAGMYIVTISTGKTIINKKIIKK